MTLAIIQCRLGSQRFPRKALAKMPDGRPIISHVVQRVFQIRGVDEIVVASPAKDAREIQIGGGGSVWPVPGPENDVLSRFVTVVSHFPLADVIVRVTGDCPYLQPHLCDRLIEEWRDSGLDYGWIDTSQGAWPDGWDCEVFTRDLLMQAHMQATDPHDREHVTPIMRRMREVYSLPPPAFHNVPKCSIDTPEDLARVCEWMS